MAQSLSKTREEVLASNVVAAIPAAGNTDLLEVLTDNVERLAVEIVLTTQAFDAFIMLARIHPDSAYVTITNAITAVPGGVVLAASGTLATLAAATTGWALLDVRPFFSVKFQASAVVDGANVTIRAAGRN